MTFMQIQNQTIVVEIQGIIVNVRFKNRKSPKAKKSRRAKPKQNDI